MPYLRLLFHTPTLLRHYCCRLIICHHPHCCQRRQQRASLRGARCSYATRSRHAAVATHDTVYIIAAGLAPVASHHICSYYSLISLRYTPLYHISYMNIITPLGFPLLLFSLLGHHVIYPLVTAYHAITLAITIINMPLFVILFHRHYCYCCYASHYQERLQQALLLALYRRLKAAGINGATYAQQVKVPPLFCARDAAPPHLCCGCHGGIWKCCRHAHAISLLFHMLAHWLTFTSRAYAPCLPRHLLASMPATLIAGFTTIATAFILFVGHTIA